MMRLEVKFSMAPIPRNDTTIEQPRNTLRKKDFQGLSLPSSCLFQFLVISLGWGRWFLQRKYLKPEAMLLHYTSTKCGQRRAATLEAAGKLHNPLLGENLQQLVVLEPMATPLWSLEKPWLCPSWPYLRVFSCSQIWWFLKSPKIDARWRGI